MLTDPIADMLTRIRNANKALHENAEMPTSRLKEGIARILKEEGYISDFHVKKGESFDTLVIQLKYGRSRERIITDLKRVSKPGRRVYGPARGLLDPVQVDLHRARHRLGDGTDLDHAPGRVVLDRLAITGAASSTARVRLAEMT